MGKYLAIVRRFEAKRQEELQVAVPPVSQDRSEHAPSWLCRYCHRPLTIEDVFLSTDRERLLTMWRCDPCHSVGVTPDTVKEPPSFYTDGREDVDLDTNDIEYQEGNE